MAREDLSEPVIDPEALSRAYEIDRAIGATAFEYGPDRRQRQQRKDHRMVPPEEDNRRMHERRQTEPKRLPGGYVVYSAGAGLSEIPPIAGN